MAEERTRVRGNSDPIGGMERRVQEKQQERELEMRNRDFDKKLVELGNATLDIMQTEGEQSYLTDMMVSFLEVALEMKKVIKTLTSLNTAMTCIFEAVNFIDGAINFNQHLQENSLKQSYGPFARWKNKRRIRKTIRNNVNRMKVAVDTITGQFRVSQEIVASLRGMSEEIRASMDASRAKAAKREAKMRKEGKIQEQPSVQGSAVRSFLAELAKQRGEELPTPPPAPTAPTSSPASGIDDISDIV